MPLDVVSLMYNKKNSSNRTAISMFLIYSPLAYRHVLGICKTVPNYSFQIGFTLAGCVFAKLDRHLLSVT